MERLTGLASKTLFLMAFLMCTFTSCEKDPGNEPGSDLGQLEFNFSSDDLQESLKSTVDGDSTENGDFAYYKLLISVVDEDGVVVLDKEAVSLYKFWDGFISEKVELKEGTYTLTEFMIINSNGEVVFATPKEGSPLAYLVEKPLPVNFIIEASDVTGLRIEVIPVGDHPPEDFGYVNFGIGIVRPLAFFTAAYINHPLIMAPSRFIEANLDVYDPEGKYYEFKLEAKVNELVIKGLRGNYIFLLKTDDYEKKFMFSYRELKMSSEDNPLLLPIGDNSGIYEMEFMASPDTTMDAMITDLNGNENFGDHPMFSASFKSEPILTVMRTTRSLMYYDIRRYLPKSATIKKVQLTLTVTGDIYTMQQQNTDMLPMYTGVFKQIVEEWKEEGVTWNNQPETTDANKVIIYYNPWIDFNKRTYDITRLFVPVDKANYPNYGFMFTHYPENISGGIEFGSSDAKNRDDRPVFKVYYTLPL
ncbi:DNRLRE domain-containing protein [Saccharicrinis sp. GN24d3]|uniref:DNRLRE domain-containing protein n=1 Tax=Saccharicrinis sp. GN24d3 TaxID=3458416 RepID=UPI0040363FCD